MFLPVPTRMSAYYAFLHEYHTKSNRIDSLGWYYYVEQHPGFACYYGYRPLYDDGNPNGLLYEYKYTYI